MPIRQAVLFHKGVRLPEKSQPQRHLSTIVTTEQSEPIELVLVPSSMEESFKRFHDLREPFRGPLWIFVGLGPCLIGVVVLAALGNRIPR
jgi:hypothetical protein